MASPPPPPHPPAARPPSAAARWLRRLQHDLVKRVLWPARDRRDAGGDPAPGELVAPLIDDDGAPIAAAALWERLRADAPEGVPAPALAAFEAALGVATAAAARGDVAGVLRLDDAYGALARIVNMDGGTPPKTEP